MEHCFRVALGMLFLVGYLQAKPITGNPVDMSDLGIFELNESVTCNDNVNFTSPTNVKSDCHNAALNYFIQGLKDASDKCTDPDDRIIMTLECLEHAGSLKMEETNSSECQWDNDGSRKKFKEFVKDLETFVQLRNRIVLGQK